MTFQPKLAKNPALLAQILTMLTYKRPYLGGDGQGWRKFIEHFIVPVARARRLELQSDEAGNVWVDTRTDPFAQRTLFTAHTDTVHRTEGRQKVHVDPKTRVITTSGSECLGADDAAGVAVLLHLMEHDVPAMYLFPAGEEAGCVGSSHMVQTRPQWFAQFDRAVAFDRKSSWSVITHQAWGRSCSDAFGLALAEALSTGELMFDIDDTGVYTDTAEFMGLIPECTNLSAGYVNEHTRYESLDYGFLEALCEQAARVDWEALPVARDPTDVEDLWGTAYDEELFGDVAPSVFIQDTAEMEIGQALQDAFNDAPEELVDLATWCVAQRTSRDQRALMEQVCWAAVTPQAVRHTQEVYERAGAVQALDVFVEIVIPTIQ